jgi:hypothetical protein
MQSICRPLDEYEPAIACSPERIAMMIAEHPLRATMADWLPPVDFSVLGHGFAPHGRDYVLTIHVLGRGTYELTLTHVVELHYHSSVAPDIWSQSWDDALTDYERWEAQGHQPEGYVWGTNWSLAYPGLLAPDDDQVARHWSNALGKPMFAAELTTDRFKLTCIFHDARSRMLSDNDLTATRVINPV